MYAYSDQPNDPIEIKQDLLAIIDHEPDRDFSIKWPIVRKQTMNVSWNGKVMVDEPDPINGLSISHVPI